MVAVLSGRNQSVNQLFAIVQEPLSKMRITTQIRDFLYQNHLVLFEVFGFTA